MKFDKVNLEKFRQVMNKGFKAFEKSVTSIYENCSKKLTQLYGNSKKNKGIFAAAFSVVFVLVVTIFSTAISNFSVEVAPAGTNVAGVTSVEAQESDVISSLPEITESEPVPDSSEEISSEESSKQEDTPQVVPLSSISAVKSSYNVNIGKSVKIGVVYKPDTATEKRIKWSSSDSSVASVDSEGNIKGVAEGTCTIKGVSAENASLAISVAVTVKKPEEPKSEKYFIKVYIGSQSVVVYSKDKNGEYTVKERVMTCSTGTPGNDTPVTTFKILRKYRWKELMGPTWEQYCSSLSSSYLFHSIPYNKKNDPSSISTGAYNALGRKASHGCIRLACIDAKWIYDNCPIGTKVQVVSGSGPKGSKVPIVKDSYYAGWDPTDPNPNSPYNKRPPSKTTTTTKAKPTTTKPTTTKPQPTTTKPTTAKPTTTKPTTHSTTTPRVTEPTTAASENAEGEQQQ